MASESREVPDPYTRKDDHKKNGRPQLACKEVTVENIKAQVDRLAELSDEEISSVESDLVSQFDEFHAAERTAESVDAMTELADMLESVRGEVVRRKAEADAREDRVNELSARVHPGDDEDDAEDIVEDVDEEEDEDDVPVTASAETEENAPETETEASIEETEVEEAEIETASEASVDEVEAPAEASVEETTVETEAAVAEVEAPAESETEFAAEEAEATAEIDAPAEAEASVIETTNDEQIAQEEAQTVTASAEETFEAPADRRPAAQEVVESPVAIVAGADLPVPAGSPVNDMKGVAKLFSDKLQTLKRLGGGDGAQTVVASFRTEYDEAHVLANDAIENDAKVNAVALAPIVAAGGFSTPTPQQYEIFKFDHTSNRPVKDLLPKFGAPRGTISYIEPPVLGDYSGSAYGAASGIWTQDMDEAAADNDGGSGDVLKNVLVLQGATVRTAELYAVTLQLQVGNFLARAFPELVERHNDLALVQHARLAEKTLLQKIDAGSTQVTQAQVLGFARDFITTVRRAAVAYRSRHRLRANTTLDAIVPDWVYDAIASDLAMNMPGDSNLGVARSEIDGYLRDAGVRLTASPDLAEFTAQGAGALTGWAASFEWYLFSPGTWGFLDGGQLDLGIIRDSGLVGTNDYRMFVESFEGIAKFGIESLAITSTIKVDGSASALKTVA